MNDQPVTLEHIELPNAEGETIRGDLRYVRTDAPKPLVIVCHSFMAFKEWGFFPHIGETLAQAGFSTYIFNFSRNGVSGDENRITDFPRFQSNTISREVNDIRSVIDYFMGEAGKRKEVDADKLVLMGHSRGGGIAIIQASRDQRVKALATLSAVSTFDRWTKHQKEQWKQAGFLPLARNSTASPLRLGIELLHDYEEHRDELSITGAASRISVPWLVLHGQADVTVPPREAEALYGASNNATTELVILEKAGHLYNGASIREDQYIMLNRILEIVISWLHRII